MNEIAAKLVDALTMFWQALDDQERRLLVLGLAWLGAMIVMVPVERRRKERELDELVAEVTRRVYERGSRG